MIIPILLFIIVCVLLFGAAAVKSVIARNLQIAGACLVFAIAWTTAAEAGAAFWWSIAVVIGGIAIFALTHFIIRETRYAKNAAEMDAERLTSLQIQGMTVEESISYMAMVRSGRSEEAMALHLKVMEASQNAHAEKHARHPLSDNDHARWNAHREAGRDEEAAAVIAEHVARVDALSCG